MKKIFSTVAMAVVALTAVVSMSSCQNGDTSSFNAAPQVPAATQKTTSNSNVNEESNTVNYYYKALVSNEMFSLFDITITRTAGSDVKKFSFSADSDNEGMMTTEMDKVSVDKKVEVNIKATFTVKANAQEVLDKLKAERGEDAVINTTATSVYRFPMMGADTQVSYGTALMEDNLKSLTLEKLQKKAEGLSKSLSMSNKD